MRALISTCLFLVLLLAAVTTHGNHWPGEVLTLHSGNYDAEVVKKHERIAFIRITSPGGSTGKHGQKMVDRWNGMAMKYKAFPNEIIFCNLADTYKHLLKKLGATGGGGYILMNSTKLKNRKKGVFQGKGAYHWQNGGPGGVKITSQDWGSTKSNPTEDDLTEIVDRTLLERTELLEDPDREEEIWTWRKVWKRMLWDEELARRKANEDENAPMLAREKIEREEKAIKDAEDAKAKAILDAKLAAEREEKRKNRPKRERRKRSESDDDNIEL